MYFWTIIRKNGNENTKKRKKTINTTFETLFSSFFLYIFFFSPKYHIFFHAWKNVTSFGIHSEIVWLFCLMMIYIWLYHQRPEIRYGQLNSGEQQSSWKKNRLVSFFFSDWWIWLKCYPFPVRLWRWLTSEDDDDDAKQFFSMTTTITI